MSTTPTEPERPLGTSPRIERNDRPDAPAPATGSHDRTATPERHGPGVVKRTTNGVKRILLVVIGALAALFAVANRQNVEVHWIFGKAVQTPLILALVVTFVAGAIIGWLVAKLGRRSTRAE